MRLPCIPRRPCPSCRVRDTYHGRLCDPCLLGIGVRLVFRRTK